jgi:hypothetical protein
VNGRRRLDVEGGGKQEDSTADERRFLFVLECMSPIPAPGLKHDLIKYSMIVHFGVVHFRGRAFLALGRRRSEVTRKSSRNVTPAMALCSPSEEIGAYRRTSAVESSFRIIRTHASGIS